MPRRSDIDYLFYRRSIRNVLRHAPIVAIRLGEVHSPQRYNGLGGLLSFCRIDAPWAILAPKQDN